ncbi:MAG: hypothetical protein K2K89_03575 [Ruminococcus sp.]|nr:hypothetical protein [Ruminococcus sp.]
MLILCITARPSDDNEIPAGIVSASDIDRIEIKEGDYYFQSYYGYIIDFNENTLTETTETTEGQSKCIKYFSDEDKENFVNKANIYGFFKWKKSYSIKAEDGGYTDFLVIYKDGSQHETSCDNAYPPTYKAMWDSYIEIFNNCMIKESDYENKT